MTPTVEAYPFNVSDFIDIPHNAKPLQLGAIAIPVYGSVTVEEAKAIEVFWAENSLEETPMAQIQAAMCTILMRSRYNPLWTDENSAKLPIHVLERTFAFLVNEQVRWQEVKPSEAIAELPQKKSRRTTTNSGGGFAKASQESPSLAPAGSGAAQ